MNHQERDRAELVKRYTGPILTNVKSTDQECVLEQDARLLAKYLVETEKKLDQARRELGIVRSIAFEFKSLIFDAIKPSKNSTEVSSCNQNL